MKQLKTLGLAVVAAAALMAFAGTGTASATVLCSEAAEPCPEGQKWPVGTTLDFSLESGTSLVWQNGGNTLETCTGVTLKADITNAGGSASTVQANNTTLSWSGCNWPNITLALGSLEIHHISGTSNGTLTAAAEISWTFTSGVFGDCIYGWRAGDDIATLTEGKPATLDMNTTIFRLGGSFLCPATGTLVGSFIQTEPENKTLAVEPS